MEERRRGGFRVKPSFGQVLGYIQEGEPLALDLPNRKASTFTASHFWLDDYPNAPEPVSETPLPHTSINPAAAFETADEGYDGVVLPARQRRRGHRSRPGPAQRRAGPAQAPDAGRPHEGERHSGRRGDRGGRRGGRGGSGEERVGEPDDERAAGRRRLAGPHAAHPEAPPGTGPPTERGAGPPNHRSVFGSGAPAGAGGPEGGGGGAPGGAGHRALRLAASGGGGSGGGRGNGRSSDRSGRGALAVAGAAGAATGGLVAAGAAAAVVGTAWAIEGGVTAASHMLGWGAETGGGTDSDASRAPHTTDVQTLNSMQDSGAVDHFFIQEQRQQPRVFRIDTDSESEPQAQPRQQIRARPIRRQGQGRQQPTPFGINQVPIPVSSGSERSRISRQSRGDRGPLATPSFDALRTASEPEAA